MIGRKVDAIEVLGGVEMEVAVLVCDEGGRP